jgi:hypothetical protein
MQTGDIYPPSPVREAELTFFRNNLTVKQSTIVGVVQHFITIFTKNKIQRGTTFHYHGKIYFHANDYEKFGTHILAILNDRAYV